MPPEVPNAADAYLAIAAEVFHRGLRQPMAPSIGSIGSQISHLRTALNYHLLTNDRLFLTDSEILLNAPLRTLFQSEPEYVRYLHTGVIVPVMREGVVSFRNLVPVVSRNWSEDARDETTRWAAELDGFIPAGDRLVTSTPDNRRVLADVLEATMFEQEFWGSLDMDVDAQQFVKAYGSEAHEKIGPLYEVAAEMEQANPTRSDVAQAIRLCATTISTLVMAGGLGLAPVLPAHCARLVDTIYGLPEFNWNVQPAAPGVVADQPGHAGDSDDIFLLSGMFVPDELDILRRTKELRSFVAALRLAKEVPTDSTREALGRSWRSMYEEVGVFAGATHSGLGEELRTVRRQRMWLRPIPGTLGIVGSAVRYVVDRGGDLPGQDRVLEATGLLVVAALLSRRLTGRVGQRQAELEDRAKQRTRLLLLDRDWIQVHYWGPVEAGYWTPWKP